MENPYKVGDKVVQIVGPKVGHVFTVLEVEGRLLYVRLANNQGRAEWSHHENYRPYTST